MMTCRLALRQWRDIQAINTAEEGAYRRIIITGTQPRRSS